jgi:hypothetical protein
MAAEMVHHALAAVAVVLVAPGEMLPPMLVVMVEMVYQMITPEVPSHMAAAAVVAVTAQKELVVLEGEEMVVRQVAPTQAVVAVVVMELPALAAAVS